MSPLFAGYREQYRSACSCLLLGSRLYQTSVGVVEAALVGHDREVLISHGSGGGYDMGLWLAQLIGGEFQYIAPSRFGYLRSPLPFDPGPESQADAYAALLDTLGIGSVVIVGLSAGGASALQFALLHSERCRGLVMLSAVSRPVPPLPRLLRALYPFMLKSDLIPWLLYSMSPQSVFQANGVSRALFSRIKSDQGKMQQLDALYRTSFPSTLRRDGMLNDLRTLTAFQSYPLERITARALVVHAVNDPIIPFQLGEYSAAAIPGARFLRLEDGGHFTCVTHSELVVPAVREFLDGCRT